MAEGGRDADDRAASRLTQMRYGVFADQKHAGQVDVKHLVPVIERGGLHCGGDLVHRARWRVCCMAVYDKGAEILLRRMYAL